MQFNQQVFLKQAIHLELKKQVLPFAPRLVFLLQAKPIVDCRSLKEIRCVYHFHQKDVLYHRLNQ